MTAVASASAPCLFFSTSAQGRFWAQMC